MNLNWLRIVKWLNDGSQRMKKDVVVPAVTFASSKNVKFLK